ncbi:serine/threonine-protein kinase [Actinoplanes utahensis]|uniref:serine/threonine-protein kinase n=1 Tax=Actinoplanes utahensis TaxID=1869 RepID=UPI00068F447E|nr:serine/threonine-protein kinase [Actinoplanes utahensis]GIF28558.1 hypothetical protein Aut01nite_15440 [Actinoplanes utahensis]
MPDAGESLGGRYRLDELIASGGMGEVWRGTDTVLGRTVAVKVLRAGPAAETSFQRRFEHEARTMAALRHPGIAAVYDYGTTPAGAYLVMARIDGESLKRRLEERGPLSPAETMSVVAQAARALHAAHQAGIVHRDVTPGNLIIEPDGNVVLVDFGVARSTTSETLTGAHNIIGTACYMAPEQVSKQTIGPATDLYALGAVAYHCLTGQPPFTGGDAVAIALRHLTEEPAPLPATVPPAVRALVERALAKDPADRPPSAAAMAAAASDAGGAESGDAVPLATEVVTAPIPRRSPVPVPRPWQPPGPPPAAPFAGTPRHPARWVALLVTVLVLLTGTGAAIGLADPFGWFSVPPPVIPSAAPSAAPSDSVTPSPTRPAPAATTTARKNPPPARTRTRTSSRTPEEPDPGDSTSDSEPVEPPGGEDPGGSGPPPS